jgi:hypothetical protein
LHRAPFVEPQERRQALQSHLGFSPENYALFEERAKRRRVQHRLAAAQAAMARFRLREAAAALDEIRTLDPDLPELQELAGELEAARRSRRARLGTWAMAAGVILGAWALRGAWAPRDLTPLPPPQKTTTATARASAPPPDSVATTKEPADGAVTTNKTMAVPSNTAVDPAPAATVASPLAPVAAARETPAARPGALETTGAVAASGQALRQGSISSGQALRQGSISSGQALRQGSISSGQAPIQRPPLAPAESVPALKVPEVDVPRPAPVVDLPSASVLSPPVPVTPSSNPNIAAAAIRPPTTDEDLVRQVLQRYRSAYERLDAASARAVWPGVNEEALARAFGDLESQTLTFQNCDVRLEAAEATATCHGTTRYIRKVGGREPRVEPRRWNFTLRRFGSDWRIETARAEQ